MPLLSRVYANWPTRRVWPSICVVLIACAGSAFAQNRSWTAAGNGPDVVLSDCRDCGDDIGIMMSCRGIGKPAEVVVHWAAMPQGIEGATKPVTFQIGSDTFSFPATVMRMGAIGFPPNFFLSPGDPFLAALQSGRQLKVQFGSAKNTIALNGARAAIDSFEASCGWNEAAMPAQQMPQMQQTQQSMGGGTTLSPPVPNNAATHVSIEIHNEMAVPVDYYVVDQAGQPQFIYKLKPGEEVDQPSLPGSVLLFGVNGGQVASYSTTAAQQQSFNVSNAANTFQAAAQQQQQPQPQPQQQQVANLELKDEEGATWTFSREGNSAVAVFGIPQTDATAVSVICPAGAAAPVMEFFAAPTGDRGTVSTVTFTDGSVSFAQPARTNRERRLEATLDDAASPLKRAMSSSNMLTISVRNKPSGRFFGLASSTAGRNFLKACPQFADRSRQ